MKTIDLNEFSLEELLSLHSELPKYINKARKAEKSALKLQMEAMAAEAGFSLDEVVNNKNKTQIGFVKAKYRNPNDFNQTWSGRGVKPKWVEDSRAPLPIKYFICELTSSQVLGTSQRECLLPSQEM